MLELVATMPSIPFAGGVLVTLDIRSRSVKLIPLPSHARDARSATSFYTLKGSCLPTSQDTYFGYFREIAVGTDWPGGLTAAMGRVASSSCRLARELLRKIQTAMGSGRRVTRAKDSARSCSGSVAAALHAAGAPGIHRG